MPSSTAKSRCALRHISLCNCLVVTEGRQQALLVLSAQKSISAISSQIEGQSTEVSPQSMWTYACHRSLILEAVALSHGLNIALCSSQLFLPAQSMSEICLLILALQKLEACQDQRGSPHSVEELGVVVGKCEGDSLLCRSAFQAEGQEWT